MAEFGKAYARSTGKTELYKSRQERPLSPDGVPLTQEIVDSGQETLAKGTIKAHWLASTITQEIMKELKQKEIELIEQSIQLAETFHSHQNHLQIINNLVRVSEVRRVTAHLTSNK